MKNLIPLLIVTLLLFVGCASRTVKRNGSETAIPNATILNKETAIRRAREVMKFDRPENWKAEATREANHWVVSFQLIPLTPDAFEIVTVCDCGRVIQYKYK